MWTARSDFRLLVGTAAGRLVGTAAMLAAAAALVLVAGGDSLFGPLGALVSGDKSRTVREDGPASAAGAAAPASAIVAAAPLAPAAGSPGLRAPGRRLAGERGGPVGPRGPGGAPGPGPPGGGGAGGPAGGGGNTSGGGGGGSPPPPGQRGVVETAAETVRELGRQAPPPARPVTDELGRLTGGLTETCRRLPVCP